MARKSTLEFENPLFTKWIDNFKKINKIKQDNELAKLLGLSPSGFAHFKRTNKFPYDKVIEFSIEHEISLDLIFSTIEDHQFKDMSTTINNTINANQLEDEIPILNEENKYILLPNFKQNKEKTLEAFIQDGVIYIFNKNDNIYINKGKYLLKKDDIYYIRCVNATVKDTFILTDINFLNMDTDDIELTKDEFDSFTILGYIEQIIKIELKN